MAEQMRLLLKLALLLLMLSGSFAETVRYYVRNREVVGRAAGSDVYVSAEQLGKVLSPEELKRVSWSPTGQISIDGAPGPAGTGTVSMHWVAEQLGFSKRVSAGTVDWVKVATPTTSALSPGTNEVLTNRRSEYRVAGQRMAEIQKSLPLSPRVDYVQRVERIGNQVVKASPLGHLKWHFLVLSMDQPNAACTGEGYVFVTDTMLDMGVSDDELAGALGHEIAHGVRRHVFRRSDLLTDITNLLKDFSVLQARINNGEDTFALRQQVDQYSKRRDHLQYKFDHEKLYTHLDEEEADVLGLRYAVTSGYSADGLGDCLRRLEAHKVKHFGTAVLEDDMSHPPLKRRLDILQRARRNAGF
jgi:predicted Zn-dependent protease